MLLQSCRRVVQPGAEVRPHIGQFWFLLANSWPGSTQIGRFGPTLGNSRSGQHRPKHGSRGNFGATFGRCYGDPRDCCGGVCRGALRAFVDSVWVPVLSAAIGVCRAAVITRDPRVPDRRWAEGPRGDTQSRRPRCKKVPSYESMPQFGEAPAPQVARMMMLSQSALTASMQQQPQVVQPPQLVQPPARQAHEPTQIPCASAGLSAMLSNLGEARPEPSPDTRHVQQHQADPHAPPPQLYTWSGSDVRSWRSLQGGRALGPNGPWTGVKGLWSG